MNRQQKLKFAIKELAKGQRKYAPEANIYLTMGRDPHLERFYKKYIEFADVIVLLEELLAQKELF